MKILNLEQFLQQRGLNFKVVVGPRWEKEGAKGKPSEDNFYIINNSLEEIKIVKGVWRKGKFSAAVTKAIDEFDNHETKMIYAGDIDAAKRKILAEGQNAYDAYIIRQNRTANGEELESDELSEDFQEILEEIKE